MSQFDETTTSSPDPLAHENLGLSSPLKLRRETPKPTPKKDLGESSNNVRLHDIYLTTTPTARGRSAAPTKGPTQAPISPWRIRVIVQAEQEDEHRNTSNSRQLFTQPSIGPTTTTTIPLKEAGESIPASRKSGVNPRKLLGRPRKRPGTPKPTVAGQRNGMIMSPENRKQNEASQIATTPKRGRGRPRKSLGGPTGTLDEKSEKQNNTAHVSPLRDVDDLGLPVDIAGPRRRGRGKASTPRKHTTQPSNLYQESAQDMRVGLNTSDRAVNQPQAIGLKRKMDTVTSPETAQRIKRSHAVRPSLEKELSELTTTSELASDLAEAPTKNRLSDSVRTHPQDRTLISGISPILEAYRNNDYGDQEVGKSEIEEARNSSSTGGHPFSDPTNEHPEFDSILESEGFSMISFSSLQTRKTSPRINGRGRQDIKGDPDLETNLEEEAIFRSILSPLQHPISEFEADNRFKANSEEIRAIPFSIGIDHIVQSDGDQTPSAMLLEPSNPPPLQTLSSQNASRMLNEVTDSTPKIVRVVRAGTALQGVMRPEELGENFGIEASRELELSDFSRSPPERGPKNLFDGFGAGTQRELRAGLRLGEELAKRRPGSTSQISAGNSPGEDGEFIHEMRSENLGSPSSNKILDSSLDPGSQQHISHPVVSNLQLPSPDRSEVDADDDQMSLHANTPARSDEYSRENRDLQGQGITQDSSDNFHNTTLQREAEWQLEREAVVRQIEMANSSRVIIIDGDTGLQDEQQSMEVMEESDIWQAEARLFDEDSNCSTEESRRFIQNQTSKPRRSRIPSPWRRQGSSRPTVKGDNGSDLFWQPGRAACTGHGGKGKRSYSSDSPNSEHVARLTGLLGSKSYYQPVNGLHSIKRPSTPPTGDLLSSSPPASGGDELLHGDVDEAHSETQKSIVMESIERGQPAACLLTKPANLSSIISTNSSIHRTTRTKISKHSGQSQSRTAAKSVTITESTSWLSYIASFVPGWGKPSAPKPLPRLPNGKRRLPSATSEGPLSRYKPWTIAHWKALYVHYAAVRENRATFGFNPFSVTAFYVGGSYKFRQWEKPITKQDSAIADAFLRDLSKRGVGGPVNGSPPIDEYVVLAMIFILWKAGVMNGECEVGIGKTGWVHGSQEWWRPDMESWYRGGKVEREGDGVGRCEGQRSR
jgi:hypothetical protein